MSYGGSYGGQQGGYGQQQGGYGGQQQQGGYGGQQGGYGGQQGGYGGSYPPQGTRAPPAQGPPPGTDPQLWEWFRAVDRDHSGNISAIELQQALVNGDWSPFDLDTVKLLMSIFDTDRSGTITFQEFAGLWKYIKDWQGVFRNYDTDRSGSIEGRELATALHAFGFNLNPRLIHLLEQKYDITEKSKAGSLPVAGNAQQQGITFDRFVRCCVVIRTLTESFQKHDTRREGRATLTYEDFLTIVLQAP